KSPPSRFVRISTWRTARSSRPRTVRAHVPLRVRPSPPTPPRSTPHRRSRTLRRDLVPARDHRERRPGDLQVHHGGEVVEALRGPLARGLDELAFGAGADVDALLDGDEPAARGPLRFVVGLLALDGVGHLRIGRLDLDAHAAQRIALRLA